MVPRGWGALCSALPSLLCKQKGFCFVLGALKPPLPAPCHCVLHFGCSFPTVALAWSPEHPVGLWSPPHGSLPAKERVAEQDGNPQAALCPARLVVGGEGGL